MVTPIRCPRPDKFAADTEAEVAYQFADLLTSDPNLFAYLCECGRWHAGHNFDPPTDDHARHIEALLDAETVAKLRAVQ